jgi:hypothetical protein
VIVHPITSQNLGLAMGLGQASKLEAIEAQLKQLVAPVSK